MVDAKDKSSNIFPSALLARLLGQVLFGLNGGQPKDSPHKRDLFRDYTDCDWIQKSAGQIHIRRLIASLSALSTPHVRLLRAAAVLVIRLKWKDVRSEAAEKPQSLSSHVP